jgi:hypothetical protein
MLSIVPLLAEGRLVLEAQHPSMSLALLNYFYCIADAVYCAAGGVLLETGAGGSAPKHVPFQLFLLYGRCCRLCRCWLAVCSWRRVLVAQHPSMSLSIYFYCISDAVYCAAAGWRCAPGDRCWRLSTQACRTGNRPSPTVPWPLALFTKSRDILAHRFSFFCLGRGANIKEDGAKFMRP